MGLKDLLGKLLGEEAAAEKPRPQRSPAPPPPRVPAAKASGMAERPARGLTNLTGGRRTMSPAEVAAIQLEAIIRRAKGAAKERMESAAEQVTPRRLRRLEQVTSRIPEQTLLRLSACFPQRPPRAFAAADDVLRSAPRAVLAAVERDPGQALDPDAVAHRWLSEEGRRERLQASLAELGDDALAALASLPRQAEPASESALVTEWSDLPEADTRALLAAFLSLTPAELQASLQQGRGK